MGAVEQAHHADAAFFGLDEIGRPLAAEGAQGRRQPARIGLAIAPLRRGDDVILGGLPPPGGLRDDVVAESVAHQSEPAPWLIVPRNVLAAPLVAASRAVWACRRAPRGPVE